VADDPDRPTWREWVVFIALCISVLVMYALILRHAWPWG
jgi:hypothetical protein